MEDNQGDVGPVVSDFVSELHVYIPSETHAGNIDCENQIGEYYGNGNDGEKMVDFVGSDVFFDWAGGDKDGQYFDFDGCDWDNSVEAETSKFPESMAVLSEADGNMLGKTELELPASMTVQNCIVSEELEVGFKESVDGVGVAVSELSSRELGISGDEAGNLGNEDIAEKVPVVIPEERVVIDESLDKNGCSANNEISDYVNEPVVAFVEPVVAFVVGETGVADKNIVLHSGSTTDQDKIDSSYSVTKNTIHVSDIATLTCGEGEVVRNGSLDDGVLIAIVETANIDGDSGLDAKIEDEKEVLTVERKDLVLELVAITCDVHEENQSCLNDAVDPLHETVDNTNTWVAGVATSGDTVNKSREAGKSYSRTGGDQILKGDGSETKGIGVEEKNEFDQKYDQEKEVDLEEPFKPASSFRIKKGQFAVLDIVWGKVRSHPWWPGQIFDSSDASEKAVKCYKKGSYLVAYFGDQTFAWNEASSLKHFTANFSKMEKQSNAELFQISVNFALEEVSRRVELGLACSCIPTDEYGKIEAQVVENTGIREESSRRYGVDHSSDATSFEPDKLLKYIRNLATRAFSGDDRLDLVTARAQLSAFCRFKGYRLPTEFHSSGELLEYDVDTRQIRQKHNTRARKKKRIIPELKGDIANSPDGEDEPVLKDLIKSISGKKRKALDSLAEGSGKRVSVCAAKVSTSADQTPKPYFKIGECICRVASQLTGFTPMVKGKTRIDGSPKIYENMEFLVNEMLSQLQLLALDPKKQHTFLHTVIRFFSSFRSSNVVNKQGRKRKADEALSGSAREFEFVFDDVNDFYWTDHRVVQNYSEEQLLHNNENEAGDVELAAFDAKKSVKTGRKSNPKKILSSKAAMESDEILKRKKSEYSPAELIMNFEDRNCIPSEINLNRMFRRFGPLMESETKVDLETGLARVIFKRGSDAEAAHNSAEKFKIFGEVLVNYKIGYSPLIPVKILPPAVPELQEDATLNI